MSSKTAAKPAIETVTAAAVMTTTNRENPPGNPNQRYGVVRYLQLRPQNIYIEGLMKRKYASEVHKIAEWDAIVVALLAS